MQDDFRHGALLDSSCRAIFYIAKSARASADPASGVFGGFLLKLRTGLPNNVQPQVQHRESIMATKNFEVQQLFKALRAGVISQEFFTDQMDELMGSNGDGHVAVPNVFAHRGDGGKLGQHSLSKTPQTESAVFTLPP